MARIVVYAHRPNRPPRKQKGRGAEASAFADHRRRHQRETPEAAAAGAGPGAAVQAYATPVFCRKSAEEIERKGVEFSVVAKECGRM
jgi:hypothetical protein